MKRDSYRDFAKRDSDRRDEKEQKIAILKKYYGRFGERIISIMMQYNSTDKGLKNLLGKLEIRVKDDSDEGIHGEISDWISTYGERRFLELHKKEIAKQLSSYSVKPLDPGQSLSQPVIPTAAPESPAFPTKRTAAQTAPPAQTPPPKVEEPKPAAQSAAIAPVEETQTPPPAQPEKSWPEIDRRSGKERRVNKDRRQDVELIFKNKRFGGDRRSGKDRRQNWKPTN